MKKPLKSVLEAAGNLMSLRIQICHAQTVQCFSKQFEIARSLYRQLHLPVNARTKNMSSIDVKRLCFRRQTLKFPRPNLSLHDLKSCLFQVSNFEVFQPKREVLSVESVISWFTQFTVIAV